MAKVIKPVAFNDRHENEARMLKHVKRKNFSGYVKKLIQADMDEKTAPDRAGVGTVSAVSQQNAYPEVAKPSNAERLEKLRRPPAPFKPTRN